jgi:hypothetical protein
MSNIPDKDKTPKKVLENFANRVYYYLFRVKEY